MKYKFYPKESRLYDFLQFPRLVYYRDEYDKRKEDYSYETITLGVSSATISYHINNFLTSKVLKLDRSNDKFGYVVDYELLEDVIEEFKKDMNFPK